MSFEKNGLMTELEQSVKYVSLKEVELINKK